MSLPPGFMRGAATWSQADRLPFRHASAWWMYNWNHGVTRWEPALNAWTSPPRQQVPFFMRRPEFHPSWALAWWTIAFVLITSLFSLCIMVTTLHDADLIDRVLANGRISQHESDQLYTSEDVYLGFLVYWSCAYLIAGILFIVWMRRMTANVPSLGVEWPRFGTGWAVGGWFVPILNLWRPVQVLNQAWRAAEHVDRDVERHMLQVDRELPNPIIYLWWIPWLAALIGDRFGNVMMTSASLNDVQTGDYIVAISAGVFAFSGVVAATFIYQLTRHQNAANIYLLDTPASRFGAPAAAPASYANARHF